MIVYSRSHALVKSQSATKERIAVRIKNTSSITVSPRWNENHLMAGFLDLPGQAWLARKPCLPGPHPSPKMKNALR